QQHVVSLHREVLAAHLHRATARRRVGADVFGRALYDGTGVDAGRHQLGGLGEVQEVADHGAERVGLFADAEHVGTAVGGQSIEVEQARVAADTAHAAPG